MEKITIGIIIITISAFGYFSNWLNWRFLNYKINHLFYYLGAFIHESSHAIACILTGAKIREYKVFVEQPRVSYTNSKIPLLGNLIISIAPIFGGLLFLFLINKYFLTNQYSMPEFNNWRNLISDSVNFLKQINFKDWKNIITIFLFLNIGSTIGPSWQDLKNVWFLLVILIFIPWPFFTHLGLMAISFIIINIVIQFIFIIFINLLKILYNFLKK